MPTNFLLQYSALPSMRRLLKSHISYSKQYQARQPPHTTTNTQASPYFSAAPPTKYGLLLLGQCRTHAGRITYGQSQTGHHLPALAYFLFVLTSFCPSLFVNFTVFFANKQWLFRRDITPSWRWYQYFGDCWRWWDRQTQHHHLQLRRHYRRRYRRRLRPHHRLIQ